MSFWRRLMGKEPRETLQPQRLDYLNEGLALERQGGIVPVNLGPGRGYSVLEVVKAFEKASGQAVPYRIIDRRPGDIASCYADPRRAKELLGWSAERDIDAMCADAWRWQSANPLGFNG